MEQLPRLGRQTPAAVAAVLHDETNLLADTDSEDDDAVTSKENAAAASDFSFAASFLKKLTIADQKEEESEPMELMVHRDTETKKKAVGGIIVLGCAARIEART